MRYASYVLLVLFTAATLLAAGPPADKSAMDKLKTLVGTWKGTDPHGDAVTVSYKLVSADNTLMEMLEMGEHKGGMVTMYCLDNGKVMMTHYCSMGNQPRMRLENSSGNTLSFAFVDGTNMKMPEDPHMHRLIVTMKDDNHFSQEWVMRAEGKETPSVFNFERVK